MKKILNCLAKHWWVGPCFLILLTLLFALTLYGYPRRWFEDMGWLVDAIFFLWIAASFLALAQLLLLLYRERKKQFLASIVILIVLIILAAPQLLLLTFLAALDAPDYFAKSHPLPENVEYKLPLHNEWGEEPIEPVIDSTDRSSCLQIWDSYQGGIYKYDFYCPSLPAGTIYLKCFEYVKNDPLSPKSIKTSSAVRHPATTEFSKIADKVEFMIYEGNFEEYYAVRVEVWQRDSATREERKLMEKVYRMEGWQR